MGLVRRSRTREAARPTPKRARSVASPKRTLFRRLPWEMRLLILAAIYLGLPLTLLLASAFAFFNAAIPDPIQLRHRDSAPLVRILARDGSLLAERGGEGSYVPIDFLPPHLIDAVVATEDRRFFEHWGVRPTGLARSLITNPPPGRPVQGRSTIPPEVGKNLVPGPQPPLTGKIR